jgi:hypothetical protein
MVVAVTDHAAERFRQRVPARRGELDVRPEIAERVRCAWEGGRTEPGAGADVLVRDLVDRDVVFVCRWDRPRDELVVITLWEAGRIGEPRVPRAFTDALRRR